MLKRTIAHPTTIDTETNTDNEDLNPLMKVRVCGNELYVRTRFDEEYDLLQKFIGLTKGYANHNSPIDFTDSGLIPKISNSMTNISTLLSSGGDEATPFKFNASYIGANHGQSNAVIVTSLNHRKTYADIGSLWEDSAGDNWNLLKIIDENTLLFLSENMSNDINKYSFKNNLSGTLVYVEYAKNTKNIIVDSVVANQQLCPSVKTLEKTVYVIINGKRYKARDGLTIGCDYTEIVEKYQIINPATLGRTLRENRPDGGYTEPQNLAVGEPIVDYNMTYRIMPDGTVLSIFDHEILENVNFIYYGGVQYQAKNDAFCGGVHRYIPKLKEFTHKNLTLAFTEPVNMTNLTYPSGFCIDIIKDLWDGETSPDRQIDYYKDKNQAIKASFACGYLPILDGEISKRSENLNAAGFLYQSKKAYPYFVDSKTFETTGTKNQRIQGVAYKKYLPRSESDISYYTIPYERDTYVYIDCHKISKHKLELSKFLKDRVKLFEIEKSQNVSYNISKGEIEVEMKAGTYGYLVLCIKDRS